jgi:tRNA A-37 threonylcarbamoyl transferase component Bud32
VSTRPPRIDAFDLPPGRALAGGYVVQRLLGSGWEGEVYEVREERTGVRRAAKLFFPRRNERDRAVRAYARKLEALRHCPLVTQYHHSETLSVRRTPVTCLISELVDGELLEDLVARQPGGRLHPHEALCLLHALVTGVEEVHAAGHYHGDLHGENVLVRRRGIHFDVKVVDFYEHGGRRADRMREDVVDLTRILYEAVGGRRRAAAQTPEVRAICKGLRSDLVVRAFPTAGHLRRHLESFEWSRRAGRRAGSRGR